MIGEANGWNLQDPAAHLFLALGGLRLSFPSLAGLPLEATPKVQLVNGIIPHVFSIVTIKGSTSHLRCLAL